LFGALRGFDIHGRVRRLENAVRAIRESEFILPENRELILRFLEFLEAEGLSVARREAYARRLKVIGEYFPKPFREACREDIVALMRKIEARGVRTETVRFYKVVLRRFFKWLRGGDDYPPEVKWLRTGVGKENCILPEELLTERDVERLLEAAGDAQTRAMVAVLWETGARVGELLNMRIKSVMPRRRYAQVRLMGKTGERAVPIIFSWPYLQQWLMIHPRRRDREAPLWLKRNGEPMDYPTLRARLERLRRRAGIEKKVNPHMFRHSRASLLAQRLTEAQLSQLFGWTQGSKMPQIYVHLSARDLEKPLLSIYGLESQEHRELQLRPVTCPRCGELNPREAESCMRCGAILKPEAALKAQDEYMELKKAIEELRREIMRLRSMAENRSPYEAYLDEPQVQHSIKFLRDRSWL